MGKIAILRRDGYGDLLHAYPLIIFLKKNIANSITLFVSKGNFELVKYLPPVDEVIRFSSVGNKYLAVLPTVWRAKKKKFDLAISAKTSPMKLMNLALLISGAKKKRAYVDNNWHGRLLNSSIEYTKKIAQLHQAVKGLKLVVPHLDFLPDELIPKIVLSSSQVASEMHWYKNTTLCISATTTQSHNRLDPIRYAKLCNAFHKKYPCQVSILGLEKDQIRARIIADHLEMPHRLIFTNFDQMMVHLWLSDLLFIGDGGLGHIRAAMDKPALVLFGQVHPNLWHPMSRKTRCLFHATDINLLEDTSIFSALERVWLNECNDRNDLFLHRI